MALRVCLSSAGRYMMMPTQDVTVSGSGEHAGLRTDALAALHRLACRAGPDVALGRVARQVTEIHPSRLLSQSCANSRAVGFAETHPPRRCNNSTFSAPGTTFAVCTGPPVWGGKPERYRAILVPVTGAVSTSAAHCSIGAGAGTPSASICANSCSTNAKSAPDGLLRTDSALQGWLSFTHPSWSGTAACMPTLCFGD